jgi:hypothetical protein
VCLGRLAIAGRAPGPARIDAIGLIAAANDLSGKMANAEYRTVVPITRFPER